MDRGGLPQPPRVLGRSLLSLMLTAGVGLTATQANTIEFVLGAWLLYIKLGLAFFVPISIVFVCFLGIMGVGKVAPPFQIAWVRATQSRIDATANVIANIKSLKMLGLENKLSSIIQSMREVEITAGTTFRYTTVCAAIFGLSPLLLSPVLTFAATGHDINTTIAFSSLSILILLTNPLASLFQLMPSYIGAVTCFGRVATYLAAASSAEYRFFDSTELTTRPVDKASLPVDGWFELSEMTSTISAGPRAEFLIKDGYFGWKESQYALHQINLSIPSSKLTMIVGPVGSGKSTLCKALLGEVPFARGSISCTSKLTRVGFCDQSPFLANASVRSVIIGYGRFDKEWYEKVVEATALWPDIEGFVNGDESIIGPNGSNLSGGQRHRLALARAIYARPTVFIFDDIFSGLDAVTEEVIFTRVFGPDGMLRRLKATVIFCTHAVKYLPLAEQIIALGADGRIVEQGTYERLKANQKYVQSLDIQNTAKIGEQSDTHALCRASEPSMDVAGIKSELDDCQSQPGDFAAYKQYLSTFGTISLSLFLILSIISAFCRNFATIWLKIWSDYNTQHPQDKSRHAFYLEVYVMIQILSLVCISVAITIVGLTLVRRSGLTFHLKAIRTLMEAPIRLFNRIPPGVLLNRFAQDLMIVDNELELHFSNFVFSVEVSLGMAVIIATASPYVAMSYPIIGGLIYVLQLYYLKTSRQLRFLDLETKSPLLYARHRKLYVMEN
jgi:ATP-binding cassette, subfamily C (CFTR/MRP), member 1